MADRIGPGEEGDGAMREKRVLSKSEARRALRRKVWELPDKLYKEGSARLCGRIHQLTAWQRAAVVCLYFPMRREPDIRPLFSRAREEGKKLLLPRFQETRGIYEPVPVDDPVRDLRPGRYGIPEPRDVAEPSGATALFDFILVPGVAFSVNGDRLGRGGGYFDRLLALTNAEKCGVAFECQIVDELPMESHDIRMDYIVTPARCLTFAQ